MKNFKEIYMYVMGALILLLLFSTIIMLLLKAVPENNKDILYLILGTAITWGSAVVFYFYGTSKGSADKTEMIYNSTPTPPATP